MVDFQMNANFSLSEKEYKELEECKELENINLKKESKIKTILMSYRSIVEDDPLIKYAAEVVNENKIFKEELIKYVFNSKNVENNDLNVISLAANAITILVAANFSFANMDLSKIKICGANIRDGCFNGCDFTEADLTGVILENCKLNQSCFHKTVMKDLKLGILSDINVGFGVDCMSVSQNNNAKEILVGCENGSIKLFNRENGKLIRNTEGGLGNVNPNCIILSPDGSQILTAEKYLLKLFYTSTGGIIRSFERYTYESSYISLIVFSFDGKMILSYTYREIFLWDAITGNVIKMFPISKDAASFTILAFSPEGKRFISSHSDYTIKLWDIKTKKTIKIFKGHTMNIISLVFSQDGNLILSGSDDNYIKWWNIETNENIKSLQIDLAIRNIILSPERKLFLSIHFDNFIRLWDAENGNLIRTFEGHTNRVEKIAFSFDGTKILSSSYDNTMKLWETQTGNLIKTFETNAQYLPLMAFNNANEIITYNNQCIRKWNQNTGNLVYMIDGHNEVVNSAIFSPDGTEFLSCSNDGTIKLWDNYNGMLIRTIYFANALSIAFSPDGLLILGGCFDSDDSLILLDKKTGEEIKAFQGHKSNVTCVLFSADGKRILSGSEDKTIKLWEINSQKSIKTFAGHQRDVNSVVFSTDEKIILSGSSDFTIRLWDICTGHVINTLKGHTNSVTSAIFSSDETFILSGSMDSSVKLWNRSTGKLVKSYVGHTQTVMKVAFTPDGSQIISSSRDGTIKFWIKYTGNLIKNLEGHNNNVTSVILSPDGKFILSASDDGTIKLWDYNTGNLLKSFDEHTSTVSSIVISCDSKLILSGSEDKTLKLWALKTGIVIRTFKNLEVEVSCVAISPDQRIIACGSIDRSIKWWDTKSGDLLRKFNSYIVTSIVFSHDGAFLLTGGEGDLIKIYDLKTGELIKQLKVSNPEHEAYVNAQKYYVTGEEEEDREFYVRSLVLSQDGNNILSGSDDGSWKLWELSTGNNIKIGKGHKEAVNSVAFSHDENYILSGSSDQTINLWDKNTGDLIKSFLGHKDKVTSVAFSLDDSLILSGSADKSIKLWESNSRNLLKNYKERFLTERNEIFNDSSEYFNQNSGFSKEMNKIDNVFILSITKSETALACENMILLDTFNISSLNETIFYQKGALNLDGFKELLNEYKKTGVFLKSKDKTLNNKLINKQLDDCADELEEKVEIEDEREKSEKDLKIYEKKYDIYNENQYQKEKFQEKEIIEQKNENINDVKNTGLLEKNLILDIKFKKKEESKNNEIVVNSIMKNENNKTCLQENEGLKKDSSKEKKEVTEACCLLT